MPSHQHSVSLIMTSRIIPLRKLVVPMSSGSDPDVIDMEDCTEAVGDWPEIDTPCDDDSNPGDQCIYNAELPYPEHRRCRYCKKLTG